jgi:hypothetical protein
MRKPLFSQGAMDFHSQGVGTGIMLDSGKSGEVYGGSRWPGFEDKREWLTARLGVGGYRLVSNDNTRELMAVDNQGGIYLNGDLYLNGEKFTGAAPGGGAIHIAKKTALLGLVVGGIMLLTLNFILVRYLVRATLRRERALAEAR